MWAILALTMGQITWTSAEVPTKWQWNSAWQELDFEPGVKLGRLSNPNWHPNWVRPGGTMHVQGLAVRHQITVPAGKKIQVWRERPGSFVFHFRLPSGQRRRGVYEVPDTIWRWRFPVGTEVTEWLYSEERLFMKRSRQKRADETWAEHEEHYGSLPTGFLDNNRECMDCHRDAGKHVSQLPGHTPQIDWYGFVRGGDTVFSFRPVDERGRVIPRFKDIVEVL